MKKHVSDVLPNMIMNRTEVVQCKNVLDRDQILSDRDLSQPNQGIDDNKVLDNNRKYLKPAWSNF